jgi:predicted ATPase
VAALVGDAGVGKSRLVYECVHSHQTQGWLVLESASVSYGKATPYYPVLDLLRRYCHLEDHDDTRTVRTKVTGQILTLDAALPDTLPALLGNDPSLAPLMRLLLARTESNPFFLEESVRALVETRGLVGELGAYRLVKPLDNLQMPATVQAVLAARIDRLPPEDKQLLQTAAVIGHEVP